MASMLPTVERSALAAMRRQWRRQQQQQPQSAWPQSRVAPCSSVARQHAATLSLHALGVEEFGAEPARAPSKQREAAQPLSASDGLLKYDFFDANRFRRAAASASAAAAADKSPALRSSKRHAPQDIVQVFRRAVRHENTPTLATAYQQIRHAVLAGKQDGNATTSALAAALSSLTIKDLRAAVQVIIGKKRGVRMAAGLSEGQLAPTPQDIALAQGIFADMHNVFAFEQEAIDCHHSLLAASRLEGTSARALLRHLLSLRAGFAQFRSEAADWTIIMQAFAEHGDARGIRLAWKTMVRTGIARIGDAVRDVAISTLCKAGAIPAALRIARSAQDKGGLWPLEGQSLHSLSSFLECISRAGQAASAEARDVASAVRARMGEGKGQHGAWHALFLHAALAEHGSAALKLAREARSLGHFQADSDTFNLLLWAQARELARLASYGTEDDVIQLFRSIRRVIGVRANRSSYTTGIAAILGQVPPLLYGHALPARASTRLATSASMARTSNESGASGDAFGLSLRSLASAPPQRRPRFSPGQVHEATLLYQRFRAGNDVPDSAMLQPLLIAHTSSFVPTLRGALRLYADLRSAAGDRQGRDGAKPRIESSIYLIMLAACFRARDVLAAQGILGDFMEDHADMSQEARADIVTGMLRAKPSYDEAYSFYKAVRDGAQRRGASTSAPAPFSRAGWLAIIDQFSKLQAPESGSGGREGEHDGDALTPPDVLVAIVEDAQAHGVGPDVKLYTALLNYCGQAYTRNRSRAARQSSTGRDGTMEEPPQDAWRGRRGPASSASAPAPTPTPPPSVAQFRRGVVGLHRLLQRDMRVVPDLGLITALMNAYNHVQLPAFALEIWHRLVMADTRVDAGAVAVILDTCGRAGMIHEARRAWAWARRSERMAVSSDDSASASASSSCSSSDCETRTPSAAWPINKDVWDAYIECLARCGAVREAIAAATVHMAPDLARHQHHTSSLASQPASQQRQRPRQKGSRAAETAAGVAAVRAKPLGPDAKTFAVLLRFAAPDGPALEADQHTWDQLRACIKRNFPAIWPHVSHIARNVDYQTQAREIQL